MTNAPKITSRPGRIGEVVTIVGGVLLGVAFVFAYQAYEVYIKIANTNSTSTSFVGSLNALLGALIPVMILGVMGWIGSMFLLRGIDFMKVERGIGLVTFKVDKGVGVIGDQAGQMGVITGVQVTTPDKKQAPQTLDMDYDAEAPAKKKS